MSVAISGVGLVLAIMILCVLSFKGMHPLITGIISVLVVCIMNRLDIFTSIFSNYMSGVASYFSTYFLVFMVGSILAKIYMETGAAESLAIVISKVLGDHVLLAVFFSSFLLCFGGINSLVVAFAAYPIALQLFKKADLPNRFIPGIMCGGMWTFAMSMPFSPQIHNIIPMEYLGTSNYSCLIPGLLCAICQAILVNLWIGYRVKKAKKNGEHFRWPSNQAEQDERSDRLLPHPFTAVLPIIIIVIGFDVLKWRIEVAMLIAILASIALFRKCFKSKNEIIKSISLGTSQAVSANIATAAIVGFGTVVKSTAIYAFVSQVLAVAPLNPYVLTLTSVNVCAGMLGSASGGISLMLESLGETLNGYILQGYSASAIHRLISMGSTALDTLPWNGTIITVLNITDLTYKEGFFDLFICCAIIPMISCFGVLLPLCMLFY